MAVTRFANVYGGGDLNFTRLIPEAVCAVLDGRRPVIRSDGSPERDFLFVDDAVAAYLAIEHAVGAGGPAAGEALNAGGGEPHAVLEVVELIGEAAGGQVEPDVRGLGNPRGGDRSPVRGLVKAAGADRLGASGHPCTMASPERSGGTASIPTYARGDLARGPERLSPRARMQD